MADKRQSALSLEYVKSPITATRFGLPYDPTGDTIQLAFLPVGTPPGSGDWKAGDWETTGAGTSAVAYYARCLIGPTGTVQLTNGTYVVWVKIGDNPETPVLQSGTLEIY